LQLALVPGAHLRGLFGCHDRPLCTAGIQHFKADKILNAVTAGLKCGCFGTRARAYISLRTQGCQISLEKKKQTMSEKKPNRVKKTQIVK